MTNQPELNYIVHVSLTGNFSVDVVFALEVSVLISRDFSVKNK